MYSFLLENVIDAEAKNWLMQQMKLLRAGKLPGETAQSLHQKFGELQTGASHLKNGKFVKGPAEMAKKTAKTAENAARQNYSYWANNLRKQKQAQEKFNRNMDRVVGVATGIGAAFSANVAIQLNLMSKKIKAAQTKDEIIEICTKYQKRISLLTKKIDISSNIQNHKFERDSGNIIFQEINNILVRYDDVSKIKQRIALLINKWKKATTISATSGSAIALWWLKKDLAALARKIIKK